MALITWSPALSVGVKQSDDQHRALIGLINDLHAAMAAGKGNQVVGPILAGLIEYTHSHFAAEEQLLKDHGYPSLTLHRVEHQKLLQQVGALQEKFKAGKALMSVEVMTFLKNWLVNHIQAEDMQYRDFLNSRGVH